jgi:hypothetical protein
MSAKNKMKTQSNKTSQQTIKKFFKERNIKFFCVRENIKFMLLLSNRFPCRSRGFLNVWFNKPLFLRALLQKTESTIICAIKHKSIRIFSTFTFGVVNVWEMKRKRK